MGSGLAFLHACLCPDLVVSTIQNNCPCNRILSFERGLIYPVMMPYHRVVVAFLGVM